MADRGWRQTSGPRDLTPVSVPSSPESRSTCIAASTNATEVVESATSKPRVCASAADGVRRGGARDPADVVGESLRGGPDVGRIQLRGHRAEPAEVAGREERHERARAAAARPANGSRRKHQSERPRSACRSRTTGARPICVADEAERHVAEPHPHLHRDDERGHRRRAQSDAARRLLASTGSRAATVEAPPGEHVHAFISVTATVIRQHARREDVANGVRDAAGVACSVAPDLRLLRRSAAPTA